LFSGKPLKAEGLTLKAEGGRLKAKTAKSGASVKR
jgi:hypothetical protein